MVGYLLAKLPHIRAPLAKTVAGRARSTALRSSLSRPYVVGWCPNLVASACYMDVQYEPSTPTHPSASRPSMPAAESESDFWPNPANPTEPGVDEIELSHSLHRSS